MTEQDYVVLYEAPKIEKPELRLYYDDKGRVICYSCEKLEGNYIVIDNQIYAECRYDLRVVEGKIVRQTYASVVSRLYINKNEGELCEPEDISILTTDKNGARWKIETYEVS